MKGMLDRLETDSPGNYNFKLLPPSALNSIVVQHENPPSFRKGLVPSPGLVKRVSGHPSHSRSEGDADERSEKRRGCHQPGPGYPNQL